MKKQEIIKRATTWLIVLGLIIFFILAANTKAEAQRITKNSFSVLELTHSTEDRGFGFNYMKVWSGIGIGGGFESGIYRFGDIAKVTHQKYRFGPMFNLTQESGSLIVSLFGSYNEYQEKYDKFDHIKDDLPKFTPEVGMRYCFKSNKVACGFTYDLIHRTGGFSIGIRFFNK